MAGEYVVRENGMEFQHATGSPSHSNATSKKSESSLHNQTPAKFLQNFARNFQINILDRPSKDELVFELIHIDVSFANALRRILLAEVPTVAIETVYCFNNSSLLHDEVLAHRLGLIPLNVDARFMEDLVTKSSEDGEGGEEFNDRNTLVFEMKVACRASPEEDEQLDMNDAMQVDSPRDRTTKKEDDEDGDDDDDAVVLEGQPSLEQAATMAAVAAAAATSTSNNPPVAYPRDRPYTKHIYSKDIVWLPQGNQIERFAAAIGDNVDEQQVLQHIKPLHDDILIAKLRPGQRIDLELHGRRGIGSDHAKFSPVATCSYRLYPKIEIVKPIYDELAEELVMVYEPGVFELVDCEAGVDPTGTRKKARVCNPYACTMSRNYTRNPELKEALRITRVPDHFIFSVESVGMYSPAVLVAEALRVLQRKCQKVIDLADENLATTRANHS